MRNLTDWQSLLENFQIPEKIWSPRKLMQQMDNFVADIHMLVLRQWSRWTYWKKLLPVSRTCHAWSTKLRFWTLVYLLIKNFTTRSFILKRSLPTIQGSATNITANLQSISLKSNGSANFEKIEPLPSLLSQLASAQTKHTRKGEEILRKRIRNLSIYSRQNHLLFRPCQWQQ